MSYQQNDPNRDLNRPIDPADRRFAAHERWGVGSVILASLAVLVVFGLFYAMSNRSETSMARTDRPAATTPATTTGSGATNRDTTTKPATPTPAPSSPPATNR